MPSSSTSYKPGQSGNPKGRPPLKEETRNQMKQNREALVAEFTRLLSLPAAELKQLGEDPQQPALTYLCARLIFQGANKADPQRLALVFESCAWPLPKRLELTGEEGEAMQHAIECVVRDYRAPEAK